MGSGTSRTPTSMIVAEISCGHRGSLDRARQTIHQVDADCIKFQLWTEPMAAPHVLTDGPWAGTDLVDLYDAARTPAYWLPELFDKVREKGSIPMATPFDLPAVDFLERLDCPIYKVASFELVDLKLVEFVAKTRKPIVLSTGQANLAEIRAAVWTAKKHTDDITLLHCVSQYPTQIEDANLKTMQGLKQHFPFCKIGLSDHSQGPWVALAATALGAEMIEKHVDLDRTSLDGAFAMTPSEFSNMAKGCREVKKALGEIRYSEGGELRRSLYWAEDIPQGTTVDHKHLKTLRPNLGLSPVLIDRVMGKKTTESVFHDQPVSLKSVE